MKVNLKQYLLFSSVFAIFTESFFFHFIIDWKLLYLIIIVNYFILIKTQKIKINKYFLSLIGVLFIHGVITNIVVGIPPNYMLAQLIGITIVGVYYYNFIPLYERKEIISLYLKICLFVAIIGYPMYFLNINLNDGRLQSIFKEPAHYVVVVLPSCYYFFKEKKYLNFFILFGTIILSNSSLGYIGCGLILLVPNLSLKRIAYLTALIPFVVGAFIYMYQEYPFFKMRVEDTYESLNVINTGKFKEDTNLSSYALISNLHVAKRNLSDHPFGTGIGSHLYMHTNVYGKEMRAPEYLIKQKLHTTNATDANSMLTRILSELGLIGLLIIIGAFFYMFKTFSSKELHFAQGIVIYIILKLIRDGHYFPPEFYFFVWILYYDLKEYLSNR